MTKKISKRQKKINSKLAALDFESIAAFHRIIKNYLKMIRIRDEK
jgi:hypothetical protein